jgi:hypothetical protein
MRLNSYVRQIPHFSEKNGLGQPVLREPVPKPAGFWNKPNGIPLYALFEEFETGICDYAPKQH